MAERAAVTLASQEGTRFSLVTLLPGTVLGPHLGYKIIPNPIIQLGGHISFSHRFLLNFLQERSGRGIIYRLSVCAKLHRRIES